MYEDKETIMIDGKKLICSNQIKTTGFGVGYSSLDCPRCGSHNLHHMKVINYDQEEENENLTIVTTVKNKLITLDVRASNEGNPSRRRDGIVISFFCEQCFYPESDLIDNSLNPTIELCIEQHKGTTFLSWRYTPLEENDK